MMYYSLPTLKKENIHVHYLKEWGIPSLENLQVKMIVNKNKASITIQGIRRKEHSSWERVQWAKYFQL